MTGPSDDRTKGGTKGDVGRRERLALELRQNLKRRKVRDRALKAAETSEAASGDPSSAGKT